MAVAAPARRRAPASPGDGRRAARKPARGGLRVVRRNPQSRTAAAAVGAGVLDRLLRGRTWIACIGVLLAGLVFFNVSLLQMNRGITQTSERSAELRRANAELRLRVAKLASSERIQVVAGELGYVLPKPGDVRYLQASPRRDARRAAQRIEAPPRSAPLPLAAVPQLAAPVAQPVPPAAAQPVPEAAPVPQSAPAPQHAPHAPHAHAEPSPEAGGAAPAAGAGTP